MLVSILGSNGLLSHSIARYCNKRNIKINIYGRSKPLGVKYSKFYQIDFTKNEIDYIDLLKSDLIIYASGAGIQSNLNEQPDLINFLNVDFPIIILKKLNKLKFLGHFITFGSYFEIGINNKNILFTEEMILSSSNEVLNDYSVTKRLLSSFLSSFKGSFINYHYILPTIYGENESNHRLIPYTINSLKNNKKLNFTSGNQVRQYIYVNEIPNIIFKSINSKLKSGIYNIAGNETLTVKELVNIIYSKLGETLSDNVFGKAKRLDSGMLNLQLDGSLLSQEIDFVSSVKIFEIIDKY
jgi:hypothetical protein